MKPFLVEVIRSTYLLFLALILEVEDLAQKTCFQSDLKTHQEFKKIRRIFEFAIESNEWKDRKNAKNDIVK